MIMKTKRRKTGELALFQEMWEESEAKRCEVCADKLHEFSVAQHAHILGKGAYPKFRLKT
jgi:hypothetical protein